MKRKSWMSGEPDRRLAKVYVDLKEKGLLREGGIEVSAPDRYEEMARRLCFEMNDWAEAHTKPCSHCRLIMNLVREAVDVEIEECAKVADFWGECEECGYATVPNEIAAALRARKSKEGK